VERAESSDSASKSIRHSTSQELQWKNSVPFMAHCSSLVTHFDYWSVSAIAIFRN
jgi:hypothetical protein